PGIDVAYYQGTVDWKTVAQSGIRYAFARVSDGDTKIDPQFARNCPAINQPGLIRGAYQYFRAYENVDKQAQIMIDAQGRLGAGDLVPVTDVEALGCGILYEKTVAQNVQHWIDLAEAATGRKVIIYSGEYAWHEHVDSTAFGDHPLWIPQYGPKCPTLEV